MFDLHRHDEHSTFDGFGSATELAELAKSKGYKALGTSNHGNTNGLIKHYNSCKGAGIKPILGVEAYFQPVLNNEKERYHLCLFAKNLKGYSNINNLMYIGEKQKYYKPIITFENLAEHSEGIICSSACIAGFISQMIVKGKDLIAYKAAKKFKKIFGEDFYIEIQPYKIDDKRTQEVLNYKLIELAEQLNIKCILTSDSHYGAKEDFDTYLKMHEIGGTKYDIRATYGERYMPKYDDLYNRFVRMHKNDFGKERAMHIAKLCYKNLEEIEKKVGNDILEGLPQELPEFVEGGESYPILESEVKKGLKSKGKCKKEYIKRCKEELAIIKDHGFADYFLIVQDYVKWAKSKGIEVGPGRGSVCNCEVAYAIDITKVDSIYYNLDFRRFLRYDKVKLPDIDLDFETDRRGEVIEYLINRYQGHAAQICSYGLYKVDNLINDLCKVCGVDDAEVKKSMKDIINKYLDDDTANIKDKDAFENDKDVIRYNKQYDNIMKHFLKMYKKVRFIGTHAAGVAITGGNLLDYTALRIDSKTGKLFTNYDLADLEQINIIKFDILGLKTMESIGELKKLTGAEYDVNEITSDENLINEFAEGRTDGVFQFEKGTVRRILSDIKTDCFEDIVAASAMNRPGPLGLGMPEMYAENKDNIDEAKKSKYYEYAKESYGTLIYQEQIQQICINIGELSWPDADKIMKFLKGGNMNEKGRKGMEKNKRELREKFMAGAIKNGLTKKEAEDIFEKMFVYSFNKGHAVGYTLISVEEMYFKLYYSTEFWYVKMKYTKDIGSKIKFATEASKDGAIVFLPHVNYTADYSMRNVDGDRVIQEGLVSIKSVGAKAAQIIEDERRKNGKYKDIDDFLDRIPKRVVNSRVVGVLKESGALEFDKKTYISRVIKYNSTLYMKGMRN